MGWCALEDDLDITMLLPVPKRDWPTRGHLYPWAYHKFETFAKRMKIQNREVVKALSRCKAGRVVKLYWSSA